MTYEDALYILNIGKPLPREVRRECINALREAVVKAERYDEMCDHKIGKDVTSKFVKSHIDKAIWNLRCAHDLDDNSVSIHTINVITRSIK